MCGMKPLLLPLSLAPKERAICWIYIEFKHNKPDFLIAAGAGKLKMQPERHWLICFAEG